MSGVLPNAVEENIACNQIGGEGSERTWPHIPDNCNHDTDHSENLQSQIQGNETDNSYLLKRESIHGTLEVTSMDSPEQDMYWVIQFLPHICFWDIHSLLHVATGF
jgi:hypothetical protein